MMLHRFRFWIKSLTQRLQQLSLQSQLIGAYVLIIIIPSVIVSLYLFNEMSKTYTQNVIDQSELLLETEKLYISNQIETMERAAQLTDSDKDVQNYLTSTNELPINELVEFNINAFKNLTRIQYNNPNIQNLRLYADNPRLNEIWPIFFHETRIKDISWLDKVNELDGRELWKIQLRDENLLERHVAELDANQPKLSLLREINLPVGHHAGVIQVDMLLKNFSPKTFGDVQDADKQLFLIDQEGQIIGKQDHPFMTASGITMDDIVRLSSTLPEGEFNQLQFKHNGRSFLLINTPIGRIQAKLIHVISLESVLKDVNNYRNGIIAANIGFIILLSIITYMMNSIILKNLKQLTQAMRQVRKGQFQTTLNIRGGGEVGVLAYHFQKLLQTINELIAQAVRKQAMTKESELRSLHNQIDSHFLYNTLENIKMLAEVENQPAISDALTSLGGMLRYNFKWAGEYVKLQDELHHIRNYIDIMNIRFDEPIQLDIRIPDMYLNQDVLKMSLQPIVENAVKHAWIDRKYRHAARFIHMEMHDESEDIALIQISDNGCGMDKEQLHRLMEYIIAKEERNSEEKKGIGLQNVQQRLQLFYGEAYGLQVHSVVDQGTTVTMRVPKATLSGGVTQHESNTDR